MKPSAPNPTLRQRAQPRQRGIVLYVALVVMVIMMLAGVAVLRSVGSGQGVAGNLAFKQNATSAGDLAATAAAVYLKPASPALPPSTVTLGVDLPAQGYLAEWGPSATSPPDPLCYPPPLLPYPTFDPNTFLWDTCPAVVQATADDGTGNRVRYVIHRMCAVAGPNVAPNVCVSVMDNNTLGAGGGGTGSVAAPILSPYFRVTTRIDGPRHAVSYTQVMMK